jgi:hypothetical protein
MKMQLTFVNLLFILSASVAGGIEPDGVEVDGETRGEGRSLLYLTVPTALVLVIAAIAASNPATGHRAWAYLARVGALPWLAALALTVFAFTGAYVGTRLRYSPAYPAAAAALIALTVYGVASFASAVAVDPSSYEGALRWTWWAIPLAFGLWIRTVLVACDEALTEGQMPESRRVLALVPTLWRRRRLVSKKQALGRFEAVLIYLPVAASALLALLAPHWFWRVSGRTDRWGGYLYDPTATGKVFGGIAIVGLVVLGLFVVLVWHCRPLDISLHAESRLQLIGASSCIVLFASLAGVFSNRWWPRQALLLAFATYFFVFGALIVHAAVTQERVLRYSTLRRRLLGGFGFLTVIAGLAAAIAPHSVIRGLLIALALAIAVPLAPLGTRALFGFTPPPPKDDSDVVELATVRDLEANELAQTLQIALVCGHISEAVSDAARDAMRAFLDYLHEGHDAQERGRGVVETGKPGSDLRRIISKKRGDVDADLLSRVAAAPSFVGTPAERLNQAARLVFATATRLSADRRLGADDDASGAPSRMMLLAGACVHFRNFFTASAGLALPSREEQERLRSIYGAWLKGHHSWADLEEFGPEKLKEAARAAANPFDKGARRKKKDRLLDQACAEVREYWRANLKRDG